MIFSELYSAYYNAVARIIARALEGTLTDRDIRRIATESAFSESAATIMSALKGERWQLLRPDMSTPIRHTPTMPLTELQKRWLRAISLDPRFRLFGVELPELDGTEPLFSAEDIYVYDRYLDGDPFEDSAYIERFRLILSAIRERRAIRIEHINRHGRRIHMTVVPQKLEYSEKDDKFRLLTTGCRYGKTVNLGRIVSCRICGDALTDVSLPEPETRSVELLLTDERNALDRAMMHFAHFEKRAEALDGNRYRITLKYAASDETELVIRVLSFGPMLKATAPVSFVGLIKERLERQLRLGI